MVAKSALGASSNEAFGTSGARAAMTSVAVIIGNAECRILNSGSAAFCILNSALHARASCSRARDLVLQLHDPVDQRLRPRRAAGNVHIHRHDLVDSLNDGVVVEDAA